MRTYNVNVAGATAIAFSSAALASSVAPFGRGPRKPSGRAAQIPGEVESPVARCPLRQRIRQKNISLALEGSGECPFWGGVDQA